MVGQGAKGSAQGMFGITETVAEIQDKAGAIDLVSCRGKVDFDQVNFGYRSDSPVLSDFDLHLRPGETVALVGRSGSGKSTVGRLLARFYDVDDRAVPVDDHDVRDLPMTALRHHLGLVLDEPFL